MRECTNVNRVPVTKLGRLVKDGKIKSIEEIYLFSLPVKEYQIIDILLPKLKGMSQFCLLMLEEFRG